jgi:hypothetical protein
MDLLYWVFPDMNFWEIWQIAMKFYTNVVLLEATRISRF